LSLGVYATTWSFYGSVGYADSNGFMFLAVYLGLTLAFILSPVLLSPILRLVREYQLTSLADLFAFRYRSQTAGVLVTLFMLAGTLPYISLQIRAVTESASVLTQEFAPQYLVVSLGVDTFENDPISFFKLTTPDYLTMGEMIGALEIPTLFALEGGYDIDEVGINVVNVLKGYES
jgi:hypothetical protein